MTKPIHEVDDGLTSPTFSEWFAWILDLVDRWHANDPTLSEDDRNTAKEFYESVSKKWKEKDANRRQNL